MKTGRDVLIVVIGLALTGCHLSQASGTGFTTDEHGRTKMVTFVSPEEYDRMTPDERARLNATVGVQGSMRIWGSEPSQPVSKSTLDRATKAVPPPTK